MTQNMTQAGKAAAFAALHRKGAPLILFNVWDAGSAKALADAGAKAVATGSASVAAAQGYGDGEKIPLELVETIVSRITATVAVPVSVDFESGYARAPEQVAANTSRLLAAGAIGVNFEDGIVGGDGLYSIAEQARRIAGLRQAADEASVPLFINARTDLFLRESNRERHGELMSEALERAAAYAEAGANGFFPICIVDRELTTKVCSAVSNPVNILILPGAPDIPTLTEIGVSRISHGGGPHRQSMAALADRYREVTKK